MTDNPTPTILDQTLHYKDKLFAICKDLTNKTTQTLTSCYTNLYTPEPTPKNNIPTPAKDPYDTIPEVKMYKHNDIGHVIDKPYDQNLDKRFNQNFVPATPVDFINFFKKSPPPCHCHENPDYYKGTTKCNSCIIQMATDGFSKFVPNEKLVIWNKLNNPIENKDYIVPDIQHEFITNFGRYFSCRVYGDEGSDYIRNAVTYEELNFWIPVDYIHLIKNMRQSLVGIKALRLIKDTHARGK
jgi:hypothetical protein